MYSAFIVEAYWKEGKMASLNPECPDLRCWGCRSILAKSHKFGQISLIKYTAATVKLTEWSYTILKTRKPASLSHLTVQEIGI